MTANIPRHPTTGAARATTPQTPQARPGPTPDEIAKRQQVSAEQIARTAREQQAAARSRALASSPTAPAPPVAPATSAPVPSVSEEAFEHNLATWGSGSGTPLTFNGLDGVFQSSGGEQVDVTDIVFVAHLDETRREWIRFNGEGNPPTLVGIGIYEAATFPEKDDLPDRDAATWEVDRFTGEPRDPSSEQYRVPIVATDDSGGIYELTSRSLTCLYAFRGLLDRYGKHPQRRKGLLPLITLSSTTYFNRKLNADKPKPVYKIVGWVEKDGSAPAKKPDLITSGSAAGLNDDLPF
jgi:hypothetical protein